MTDLNALREQAAEAARKYQEELARAQREGIVSARAYVHRLNELYLEAQQFAENIDLKITFSAGYDEFDLSSDPQDWNSSNC